jgi:hypothetical protein
MPSVPNFLPSTNAPLFRNSPWPAGTNLNISIMGLPPVAIDATQMGLCGGMSFLARDIYEASTEQLRNRVSSRIPAALAQHLLGRLIQSFDGGPVVARWLSDTQALNHDTIFRGAGLYRRTLGECPAVMADIDGGVLCPIGLILIESFGPWDVFQNHVVLVWRYELNGDMLTLFTYDCNEPGRDDITITLDISSPVPAKTITTNGTDGPNPGSIRGFFRLPYTHADPSPAYIDDAVANLRTPPPPQMTPGQQASVTVDVTNRGSTTWTAAEIYRLGSQAPQDNLNWGLGRVELPDSVEPDQTVSFDFTVTAPGQAGSYGFSWQMLREGVLWFGTATPPLPVAVGTTGGVCDALHAQHLELATALADVRAEIATIDWSDPFLARREAAILARRARALQQQLRELEAQQTANGCAPG